MTGDESGRRTRRPDVLGSLPGAGRAIDPAVLEEILSGIADSLRKMDADVAALKAGRAEPVTEALGAAVEDAVKKIVAARPADAGTGEAAAIASRADGMETAAARMEAGRGKDGGGGRADREQVGGRPQGDGGAACRGPLGDRLEDGGDRERRGQDRGRSQDVEHDHRDRYPLAER